MTQTHTHSPGAAAVPPAQGLGGGADGAGSGESRYAAFISYRHVEPDRMWATWLHTRLETYRVPSRLQQELGLPPRLGRVFRDEEELPASADLSREIDTALQASRFLIVICSPRTPGSQWVNKEVQRFRELGRHDRILALLIEGEPAASFPRSLCEIRRSIVDGDGADAESIEEVEPLAADVRPARRARRGGHLRAAGETPLLGGARAHSTRGASARAAKLRLLATLLGVRYDELRQRDHERRNRRIRYAGIALVSLLCLMTGLAVFAFHQKNLAVQQTGIAQARQQDAMQSRAAAEESAKQALAERRMAEQRLAESLVSQGEALARAGRWAAAKARFEEASALLRRLDLSSLRADLALLDAYRVSPPPLNVMTQPQGRAKDDPHVNGYYALIGHNASASMGQLESIESMAYLPDGRHALTGTRFGPMTLWDLPTGRRVREFDAGRGGEKSISVCADGTRAVAGNMMGGLVVWDLVNGTVLRTINLAHLDKIATVAISPDGMRALSVGKELDPTLKLWDLETGEKLAAFPKVKTSHILFSPDGRTAATGQTFYDVRLFDLEARKEIDPDRGKSKHWKTGRGAFAANGHFLIVDEVQQFDRVDPLNEARSPIRLWDVTSGREVREFPLKMQSGVSSSYSSDGRLVLFDGPGGSVRLRDMSSGRDLGIYTGHSDLVISTALSPDARLGLSASWDRTLRVWPTGVDDAGPIRWISRKDLSPHAQSFSHDGRMFCRTTGKRVEVRDAATLRLLLQVNLTTDAERAAFAPDGTWIAIACGDGRIRRCELASSSVGADSPVEPAPWLDSKNGPVADIAFSPDGRLIAGACKDGATRLWEVSSGALLGTLSGHVGFVTAIAFSPDGTLLISGSNQRHFAGVANAAHLILWDVAARKQASSFPLREVEHVAFAPDGRHVVAGGNADFVMMTVTPQHELRDARRIGRDAGIAGTAFSPDGSMLVSAHSNDDVIRFWASDTIANSSSSGGGGGGATATTEPANVAPRPGGDDDDGDGAEEASAGETGRLRFGVNDATRMRFSPDGRRLLTGHMMIDLQWVAQLRQWEPRVAQARTVLQDRPDDAMALQTMGEWYAFRGVWDWAADLLLAARAAGAADVSLTLLAGCEWQASRFDAARVEYQRALDASHDEPERLYLRLCLNAAVPPVANRAPPITATSRPSTESAQPAPAPPAEPSLRNRLRSLRGKLNGGG